MKRNYSIMPEVGRYSVSWQEIDRAVVCRGIVPKIQREYQVYRLALKEAGIKFNPSDFNRDDISQHMPSLALQLTIMARNGIEAQRVSQVVFKKNHQNPRHRDGRSIGEEVVATMLFPVCHDAIFIAHHDNSEIPPLGTRYGVGDMIVLRQSPQTLHEALCIPSPVDSMRGFNERILIIADCVSR
jgi:hypothetical protein